MKKALAILISMLLVCVCAFSGCAGDETNGTPIVSPSGEAGISDSASGGHQPGDRYTSTISIEGTEEPVLVELIRSEACQFTMEWYYADFEYTSSDGYEHFQWMHDDTTVLSPGSYISISRQEYDAQSVVDQCENSTSRSFDCIERIDTTLSTYDAVLLAATNSHDDYYPAGTVMEQYVISSDSATYLIEVFYNVEAAEGVYARMKSMLDTFVIE